ncbi:MAG: hypothetical protein LBL18_01365 [Bacteroidales bacterium]|jgi:hypothetical protein|nr:hypothetical protein [Bacteroidales bacterium]
MARTLDQLKTEATSIRNETAVGANTSERIGSFLEDFIDDLQAFIGANQTALNAKANIISLAGVATSGSYTDLANQPFIPKEEFAPFIIPDANEIVIPDVQVHTFFMIELRQASNNRSIIFNQNIDFIPAIILFENHTGGDVTLNFSGNVIQLLFEGDNIVIPNRLSMRMDIIKTKTDQEKIVVTYQNLLIDF